MLSSLIRWIASSKKEYELLHSQGCQKVGTVKMLTTALTVEFTIEDTLSMSVTFQINVVEVVSILNQVQLENGRFPIRETTVLDLDKVYFHLSTYR